MSPSLKIDPEEIDISGVVGVDAFEGYFTLTAINQTINGLEFNPSTFKEASNKRPITGNNVKIEPNVTKIDKDHSQDFYIVVNNIHSPGKYQGYIDIKFNLQEVIYKLPVAIVASSPSKSIDVKPENQYIYGITGQTTFEYPFKIAITKTTINNLSFTPENLYSSTTVPFINSSSIEIKPSGITLKSGEEKEFIATIKNVDAPGQYSGDVKVDYKERPDNISERVPILIRAVEIDKNPSPLVLRFENYPIPVIGGQSPTRKINIFYLSGREPEDMIHSLTENSVVTVNDLKKYDNGSTIEVINSEDILVTPKKGNNITLSQYGNSIGINVKFKNPGHGVEAGNYNGTIDVISKDLGTKISIPVLIQVRWPGWLAMLVIFLGISLALLFQWWNSKGKRKTKLEMEVKRLRGKLDSSRISKKCEDEIKGQLSQGDELLDKEKFDDVEKLIPEIDKKLEKCIKDRKELKASVSDVEDLINRTFKKAQDLLHKQIDNLPLGIYLKSLSGKLRNIEAAFDSGHYTKLEDLAKDIEDIKKEIDTLIAEPKGILPILKRIDDKIESLDDLDSKVKEAWEIWFSGLSLRDKLAENVKEKKDVESLLKEVKSAESKIDQAVNASTILKDKLRAIEKLNSEEGKKQWETCLEKTMRKAKIPTDKDYLEIDEKIKEDVDKRMIEIANRVDKPKAEMLKSALTSISPDYYGISSILSKLKIEPGLSSEDLSSLENYEFAIKEKPIALPPSAHAPQPPEIHSLEVTPCRPQKFGSPIKLEANASDPEGENLEYRFVLKGPRTEKSCTGDCSPTGWIKDSIWVWTPCETDKGMNEVSVEVRSTRNGKALKASSDPIKIEVKDKTIFEKLWDWWTPERRTGIFGPFAYALIIIILAVLGYSQLYSNNPTFGANNFWQEYLYLFLWGFGIQSATATVAGVRQTILGS